jgi:small conductance mechanosensitive channel
MFKEFFELMPSITTFMFAKFVIAAVILFVTHKIVTKMTPLIHDLCQKNNCDENSSHLLSKVVRYILTIVGVTIALQNLGVEVSALIAAFGITGIVLSYGMKDIVANFIAGIVILAYKHIKINDFVKTKDWEGQVTDINLRYTTLRHNNMEIFVPNLILYTETVAIVRKD